MKEKVLLIFLILLVAVSVFFTYQRSFVWQNFELINSEEELEPEEMGEEESLNEEILEDGAGEESAELLQ
ncbi:MAG TPA: hypothetical protein VJA87_01785 [Candidatus Paceibacterota bacterium]